MLKMISVGLLSMIVGTIMIVLFLSIFSTVGYWFGWLVGLITTHMINIQYVYGMEMPQFMGVLFMVISLFVLVVGGIITRHHHQK